MVPSGAAATSCGCAPAGTGKYTIRVSADAPAHTARNAAKAAVQRIIVPSPSSVAGFAPVVVRSLFGGLRFSSRFLPAFDGGVIGLPRLDPIHGARTLFLLPERRAGLEVVHQKFGGSES